MYFEVECGDIRSYHSHIVQIDHPPSRSNTMSNSCVRLLEALRRDTSNTLIQQTSTWEPARLHTPTTVR